MALIGCYIRHRKARDTLTVPFTADNIMPEACSNCLLYATLEASGALFLPFICDDEGQWQALIAFYGQHRSPVSPVARSKWLLWPTPQVSGTL